MNKMLTTLGVAAFLCLATSTTLADAQQGLAAATAAYEAGKFDEALPDLRKAAEQGDAEAQRIIGKMYALGQGVTQVYQQPGRSGKHLFVCPTISKAHRNVGQR
jgi:TPR repeat protein